MRNATIPGATRYIAVFKVAPRLAKKDDVKTLIQPSIKTLMKAKERPMAGASQNIVAAGLSKPIFLFLRSTWDRPHRRPPRALALSTRRRPDRTKCVSVATISTTPLKIRSITPTRRKEKGSKRKRNAKSRTNIKVDDLHIAEFGTFVNVETATRIRETYCRMIV